MIYYLLSIIILLGAITSYEDIKIGKIRNKWLIWAISINIILHTFLYTKTIINGSYIGLAITSILVAFIISFFIYILGLWSAGDAKLFVVFTSLIPVWGIKTITFNLLAMFVNSILPLFLFYLMLILFRSSWKQKKQGIKAMFNIKKLAEMILFIFSLSWIARLILGFFNIRTDFFLMIGLIILLAVAIKKLFKKERIYLLILIAVIRVFLNIKFILSLNFLVTFILFMVIYRIIRIFIWEMGTIVFSTEIKTKDLKPGMVPAEVIRKYSKEGKESSRRLFKKIKITSYGFSKFKDNKSLVFQPSSEGLTKKDINQIKKIGFKDFAIQNTTPFAPFLFLGAILTIICGGSFISYLLYLIG